MTQEEQQRYRRALTLFDALLDLPPEARASHLEQQCAGDAPLRALLESMLAADGQTAEPLLQIAARAGASLRAEASRSEGVLGRQIGPWQVTAVLGYGGMGAVYEVQRADAAYAQRAALKLIRATADSPLARERFLRERQMLAGLQHPNIATLLDGGFTTEGDPYFVMEYIDGLPLIRWCDERGLGLRERVQLFAQVLDAVGYAHRNLVVHRDLKPSNLLVDGAGRVKLLDFGVAKQLEGSEQTRTGDRAMTFEYASPEQLHQAPITTATDIWQLGIVLHRLLSGSHPFGITQETPLPNQLRQLEAEPEPLTRAAARASAEQATRRGASSPAALAASMRGSLAAIVAGCLRREPEARYASVDALAADLTSWLEDRPIAAAGIGGGERARLWLRRNRLFAVGIAAVAAILVSATGVSLWQAREARAQARIAEQQSANARAAMQFLTDTLAAAAPGQAMNTEVSVRLLLDKARAQLEEGSAVDPAVRQPVQRLLGHLYHSLGESRIAAELFAAGLANLQPQRREDALALAEDLSTQATTLTDMEQGAAALAAAQRAASLRTRFAPADVEQQLRAHNDLGLGYYTTQQTAAAEEQWTQAIALAKSMPAPPVEEVIDIYQALGALLREQSQHARALQALDEGLAFADRRGVPADSPLRITLLRHKAEVQVSSGQAEAAEATIRTALALQSQSVGEAGLETGALYNALGLVQFERGHFREAAANFARANALMSSATDAPAQQITALSNEATVNESAGDYARARLLYNRAIAQLDKAGIGAEEFSRRGVLRNYARVLFFAGDFTAARELLLKLQEQAGRIDGVDSQEYAWVLWQRVVLARRMRDVDAGLTLLQEARERWAKLVPEAHPIFTHMQVVDAVFADIRGQPAAAERDLREAADVFKTGARPVDAAAAQVTLAGIRFARGDRAEARQLLDKALPVLRDAVLPTHVSRAEAEVLARKLGMPASSPAAMNAQALR